MSSGDRVWITSALSTVPQTEPPSRALPRPSTHPPPAFFGPCWLLRGSSSVVMCRGSLQGNHKASPAEASGKGRKTGVRSGWERGFKPQGSFSGLGRGLWPRRGPLDMAHGYRDRRPRGWRTSELCPRDHWFSSEQMCLRQGLAMKLRLHSISVILLLQQSTRITGLYYHTM